MASSTGASADASSGGAVLDEAALAGAEPDGGAAVEAVPVPTAPSAGSSDVAAPAAGASVPASSGATTPMTSSETSSGVLAPRRAARNSGRISARESWARSFRCWSSVPAGAVIAMIRSAGPSGAPKSTGSLRRTRPSAASRTASVRQWGIAKPPGMPVAKDSSRFSSPASRPSRSARPVAATRSAIMPITACLSPGGATSSLTSSGVISAADIGFSFERSRPRGRTGQGVRGGRRGRRRSGPDRDGGWWCRAGPRRPCRRRGSVRGAAEAPPRAHGR